MNRFNTFSQWYQNLPINPPPEFYEFIRENKPLSKKLREKWLYELARTKDWSNYALYYQDSNDTNLVCYKHLAQFNLNEKQQALKAAIPLWLNGESQPPACNVLFDLLVKEKNFDPHLITQRIALALEKRNVSLARYLLKQYAIPRLVDVQTLTQVHQYPGQINRLPASEFNSYFYLYALKRMVSLNMNKALIFWERNKNLMKEAQNQAFLAHVALYKAMRNDQDVLLWFHKIKPEYYNDTLIDWQIRAALKIQDWAQVVQLIQQANNKELPCWRYWLARALEHQGDKAQAHVIYEALAQHRHYYGFLASIRIKRTPQFENDPPINNKDLLKPYQAILDQIKTLYRSNTIQAARLLHDFMSELPKDEASALIYWVSTELLWHVQAIALSNNELLNNQLTLRFPLAYQKLIALYAKKYSLEPAFVYAIIRQESSFREDARSSVGALGLMQVMPGTALSVSKTNKINYASPAQLLVPEKNIHLGIAYLQELAKRFNQNPLLMAASYNAGPRQVVYWLKNHSPKEIDIWIETLPWQETRNYLKNVMAFYLVYQYRLNQKPNLSPFLQL